MYPHFRGKSMSNTSRIGRPRAGPRLSPGSLTPGPVSVAPDSLSGAALFGSIENLTFSYWDNFGWPLR